MPQPYSNCLSSSSIATNLSAEMSRLNMTYSRANCYILCLQKMYIDEIGCYDMRLPRLFEAEPCLSKREFERIKAIKMDAMDESVCSSMCPQECETGDYNVAASYMEIPSFIFSPAIHMTNINYLTKKFRADEQASIDMLERSYVALRVHFKDIKVTVMEESPAINVVGLISNIGGTMGIFIEFRIMRFVSLVQICIEIVFIVWKTRRRQQ